MKNSNQNKKDISKFHKEKLGMDIPEDYFAKSKAAILNKVIKTEEPKQTVFWLKPLIAYPIAASIILALTLTIWMHNESKPNQIKITNTKDKQIFNSDFLEDDFLVSSLMVPDAEMNHFLDSYLLNNVVIEAEKSEQELENIFMNSILIEDSLIDSYIDKSLIENIVL
jgi:hypothetical protein